MAGPIPSKPKELRFIQLEDVIGMFLDELFPGFQIKSQGAFRVLRDSDIEFQEEAEDLVRSLRKPAEASPPRQRDPARARSARCPIACSKFVIDELEVARRKRLRQGRYAWRSPTPRSSSCRTAPICLFKPFTIRFPERIREFSGDCFAAVRNKDIVVHHPYESFDVVVQYLRQAVADPNVMAIKWTLYRTSRDSPIMQALKEAVEAGKSVTAVVELKARFDEAANIRWARDLESAGVHVVYGFIELKTHAKLGLIVRREGTELTTLLPHRHRQLPPADGARLHGSVALHDRSGDGARRHPHPEFRDRLRRARRARVHGRKPARHPQADHDAHRRRDQKRQGRPARPASGEDERARRRQIISALYEASNAGVPIDLVVRGMCCLRPGIPGLSSNIRVKSIVGRFLEHARIYCFANGEALPSPKAAVYISSADMMPRNLDRRVEAMAPIHEPDRARAGARLRSWLRT